MILKGVRGDYVGKYQVEIMKMKMKFRKLSEQFKSNYKIMDGSRLTKRTFYRY